MNTWKDELQITPDCIAIDRIGEDLTSREQSHLAHCARCQTEVALFNEINAPERAEESRAVKSVAEELHRRFGSNVVSISSKRRWFQPASLAAAAMLVIALAIGVLMQTREPAIEGPVQGLKAYRSAAVEVVGPAGDVTLPPNTLEWKPVANASEYDVQVFEVDHTQLWHASTRDSRVSLPSTLVNQFVPGKTILWQVQARHGQSIVADSGTQRFRVRAAQ